MDRISQLPDLVVNHILSFFTPFYGLPAEPVRMSVLSKTWFHLTASFPCLYFVNDESTPRESFFKYVDYTTSRFCHQNLPAHRFQLITDIEDPAELDIVNRCIELVLKNGVEELVIDITDSPESLKYRLPNTLLSVSVLKWLNISGCELPSSLMVDAVKFKSLNFLRLRGVDIDNEAISYLATSCPLLQSFRINNCNGFNGFCVYGHQNLLNVSIFNDQVERIERIDIDAPNLSELMISQADGEPPQMNVASCKKLTTVTYFSGPLQNSNGLNDFLSNFQFIENYTFLAPTEGNNLKLSSHSLRRLMVLSECDLEDIELDTPNLDLFVYSCLYLDLSRVGRSTRLKACMLCYLDDSIDTLWFHELRLFLGKKNGFKALNLCINTTQKFTELEELKAIELPCYELEHVELLLDEHGESSNYAAFVDAVLWCYRPRSLTLISSSSLTDFDEQNDVVLFTYERLLQQEDQRHTNIKIVSPSSLLVTLNGNRKAISFIKEEVIQEEADNQRFAGLKIF